MTDNHHPAACPIECHEHKLSLMPPSLLTAIEAARALRISRRKLWQLTAEGTVPAVRIGRSVRYSVTDLARVVTQLTCRAEPSA